MVAVRGVPALRAGLGSSRRDIFRQHPTPPAGDPSSDARSNGSAPTTAASSWRPGAQTGITVRSKQLEFGSAGRHTAASRPRG